MSEPPITQRVTIIHPDEPENEVPAYLTWHPTSMAQLKVDLIPSTRPAWLTSKRIDRVLVIDPEPATLFDLLTTTGGHFHPLGHDFVNEYGFQSSLAVWGGHLTRDELIFDQLDLEIEGCSTWFGIHGFDISQDDVSTRIVRHTQVDTLFWDIGNGWSIGYGANVHTRRFREPGESLHIEEVPILSVRAPSKVEFKEIMRNAVKALAFVEFAIDDSITVGRVTAVNEGLEIAGSLKQKPRKQGRGVHWLFFFQVIKQNVGDHLAKWFDLYDSLPLALDLYRTCKRTSELEVEFRLFSIISALESLHRSRFGEGLDERCPTSKRKQAMSLEQRLLEIVAKYENWVGDLLPKKECRRVADTRNYLAHQTENLKARSFEADQWFFWYRRLSLVFEICLLAELPFVNPEARENIVAGRWNSIQNGSLGEWNL
jgi:hypothetical protein